ncbi:MAG: hypothetical protein JWM80_5745 [Cyanobacteria bacterium RYN_339]|nr:hypothetical protein [Cyanobacteria bacterium RYN_339]
MGHVYHCPTCGGSLRATGHAARDLDFFCKGCRLAVSVVDDHWAQVMRSSDLSRQTVPVALVRVLRAAEPQTSPNGSGPLAC